tara:strand:- start:715 stop:2010 length:1296 start_codon:yes stop_codon:yes gene_type:complete
MGLLDEIDQIGIMDKIKKIFLIDNDKKKIDGIRDPKKRLTEYLKNIFINPKGYSTFSGFLSIILSLAFIHSIKSMDSEIDKNGNIINSDKFLAQSNINIMSFASKFMKDDKIIINEDDKIKFMDFTPVNVLLSFGLTDLPPCPENQQGGNLAYELKKKLVCKGKNTPYEVGDPRVGLFSLEIIQGTFDLIAKIPATFFRMIGKMFKKTEMVGPMSIFYPIILVLLLLLYLGLIPIFKALLPPASFLISMWYFVIKRKFKFKHIFRDNKEEEQCRGVLAPIWCLFKNGLRILLMIFAFSFYFGIATLLSGLVISGVLLSLSLDPWLYLLTTGVLSGFSSKNVIGKSLKEELKFNFSNRYFLLGTLIAIFLIPYVLQTQAFFGNDTRNVKNFSLLGGIINSKAMYYSSFIVTFLILYMSYKEIKSKGSLVIKD